MQPINWKWMVTISVAFIVLASQTVLVQGKCNYCGDNDIACVNRTSFKLCFDGEKSEEIYTCPEGMACVGLNTKCAKDDGNVPPECDQDTSGCDICNDSKLFTCTSRTTFAQCDGTTITTTTGKCPEGFVCDTRSNMACVNECNAPEQIECDREFAA